MAKTKAAGLGRGLGDLLEDNSPTVGKVGSKVIVRSPEGDKVMKTTSDIYEKDKKPKNKSVLANYR